MTTFRTFASGSSGNAALVVSGETRLLIDFGISCRRVCQALSGLGLTPEDLTAILISHEHIDHIKGLATYVKKYATPVVCTPGTARQIAFRTAGVEPLLHPAALGETLRWPGADVELLPTSHDCAESAAFRIATPDGQIGYLTDTGYIPEETGRRIVGADLLVLESNYDEDMLWAGPYPPALKMRVGSERGHLSNAAAAAFAGSSAQAGTRTILLAHLSRENNTPLRALGTVRRVLAESGWTGRLDAAPRDAASGTYRLESTPCSE